MATKKDQPRKVTVLLPEEMVQRAMKATGLNLTQTIRDGLELLIRRAAYDSIRSMRGKVKFTIDPAELRKDRGVAVR